MTQEIQLTPAELEMIQLKREQDELKKREEALQKQAKREIEIATKRRSIERAQTEKSQEVTVVKQYHKELAAIIPVAQLVESTLERLAEIKEYTGDGKWETTWSEDYELPHAVIKIGNYMIVVQLHSQSHKMYISGNGIDYKTQRRGYTRAKKVAEVINTTIANIRYSEEQTQKKLNAVESTIEKMKALYPDADVTSDKDHISYGGGYRRPDKYEAIDTVRILFKNGISINYRVYTDGTIGRRDIQFGTKDQWHLMNLLATLDTSEKTQE